MADVFYPEVTDAMLADVVQRIRMVGDPRSVVLFGSHARGDARSDSDLDILIIEESELPRYRRASRYLKALVGVFPCIDLVVWTPREVEEWADVPNAFISTALREGMVLYDR